MLSFVTIDESIVLSTVLT
jgi:hypothetical protein